MASNGNLPDSMLMAVPGGRLARGGPAESWNATCYAYRRATGRTPLPNGPDSTYRSYSRQVYWKSYWCNRGACGNAATPGYSNHGWGRAIDGNSDAQRAADSYSSGAWSKGCSDAPWEAWHRRYCGGSGPASAPVVKDPLTKRERRLVNELITIRRRRWKRPRGVTYTKAEFARMKQIKKALRKQMRSIRVLARKTGWDRERRRTRYRVIKRAVFGS